MVKHLSTMRETWVRSLGWEDLLEKEMAIHFSTASATTKSLQSCPTLCDPIDGSPPASEKAMAPQSSTFAWKIPWREEPGRLQSMGSLESDMTERLHFQFSLAP